MTRRTREREESEKAVVDVDVELGDLGADVIGEDEEADNPYLSRGAHDDDQHISEKSGSSNVIIGGNDHAENGGSAPVPSLPKRDPVATYDAVVNSTWSL